MVKSPHSDVTIPEIPVHQVAFMMMQKYGDRVGLVDGVSEKEYTYKEIFAIIKSIASALKRMGLQQRDIVAFLSPNSPEYVFMFFAVLACGATVTTINSVYTVYEVSKHLEDSKAKYMFVSQGTADTAIKAGEGTGQNPTYIVAGSHPGCVELDKLRADDGTSFPEKVDINVKEDVAVIPYSSGTTGFPKGVMITHYNLVAMVIQISHPGVIPPRVTEDGSGRVKIGFLPFFHAYGMVALVIGTVLAGDKIITMPRFEPERFLQIIEKYKVTDMHLVPPVIVFFTKSPLVKKYDLSSVEIVASGAAPLSAETEKEFVKLMNVPDLKQGYGMTETTLACAFPPFGEPVKAGSCGVPLPNCEVQIVDPETKAVLGPGERGEIWVRGPNIMKGYLNRPEATRETLDDQGWLHTGDIGYYDEDAYIFIVDRIKELIKYKGFQVAPAELESLLLNHSQIDDVAVIGVPDNDAGELPRAYVVKKPGSVLTEDDVKKHVADHVSSFKHLRGGVEFVTSVPKSQSGKILRKDLRAKLKKTEI